eukprot:scaffold4060_cov234-Pinguiococcus_pyrenoidosus.AAC.1
MSICRRVEEGRVRHCHALRVVVLQRQDHHILPWRRRLGRHEAPRVRARDDEQEVGTFVLAPVRTLQQHGLHATQVHGGGAAVEVDEVQHPHVLKGNGQQKGVCIGGVIHQAVVVDVAHQGVCRLELPSPPRRDLRSRHGETIALDEALGAPQQPVTGEQVMRIGKFLERRYGMDTEPKASTEDFSTRPILPPAPRCNGQQAQRREHFQLPHDAACVALAGPLSLQVPLKTCAKNDEIPHLSLGKMPTSFFSRGDPGSLLSGGSITRIASEGMQLANHGDL